MKVAKIPKVLLKDACIHFIVIMMYIFREYNMLTPQDGGNFEIQAFKPRADP